MRNASRLLGVADLLFEAAMMPGVWAPALEALVDHLRGEHAVIFAQGAADGQPILAKSARMGEAEFKRFLLPETTHWMAPFLARMPGGIAVTSPHGMADRDFERTELYNEVLRPASGFYSVAVRDELPEMSILIAVCRRQCRGNFAAHDAAALQTILPVLSTGVQLQQRLQLAEGRCEALTAMLDRLDDGAILTDQTGRPIFLNARAARIVAEADGLAASPLAGATPIATQRLRAAVAAAAADASIAAQQIRLARHSHRPPLLLTVLPVWRLGAFVPGVGAPRVAILIRETDAPIAIDSAALREAFNLTPRECDVATRLAGGLDLDRIAAELRIGRGTVRSHLMKIYEKTGTHSQAALVALVVRFVAR
jgi:DNA-binding CsgD family transcriptional regulator/PAS domain-containing protein